MVHSNQDAWEFNDEPSGIPHGIENCYILIYYFNGELAVRALVDEICSGDALGFYCPITWVELLCYPGLSEIEANQIR